MPTYDVDGESLHYDERGAGSPVVVIGGGPARHPDYLGDLAGATGSQTLVLPHLRGIGGSPFPSEPSRASWWSQAVDLEALRNHLGIPRLTVVGHSAGSRVALAFAVRFPSSIERLVLLTPPAGDLVDVPSDVTAIRQRREGEPAYAAALRTAQQGPPTGEDDEAFTAWQREIAPLSYARWGAAQQEHARVGAWSVAPVRAYSGIQAPASFRDALAAVRSPVRVIAATDDGVTGLVAPLALAEVFADGRGVALTEAGHYPWVDQPIAFLDALLPALTGA